LQAFLAVRTGPLQAALVQTMADAFSLDKVPSAKSSAVLAHSASSPVMPPIARVHRMRAMLPLQNS